MKYFDSVRRAGRSLRSAKGRTILTSLAISVGAFTLALSLAAGEGARRYVDTILSTNVNKQAVFVSKDKALTNGGGRQGGLTEYSETSTSFRGATYESLSEQDMNTLRQDNDVRAVIPTYLVAAKYFTVEGIDKKFKSDITLYDSTVKADVAAGSLPPLNQQIADDGAVIPEAFLEKLNNSAPGDMIGRTITLYVEKPPKTLTEEETATILREKGPEALQEKLKPKQVQVSLKISAVTAKSVTSFSASRAVFISQNKAAELSDMITEGTDQYRRYVATTVLLKDGVDPVSFKERATNKGLVALTAQDAQQVLFSFVNILQGIVVGFAVITLIASIFGIINTQYIAVLERTREIGLMKSLGMRGRHVSRLFQLEAAWIGFLGGVLGAVSAAGVAAILNPVIEDNIKLGQDLLVMVWWQIGAMIIGLIIIAMVAGFIPALKAARLDPIEALRTE